MRRRLLLLAVATLWMGNPCLSFAQALAKAPKDQSAEIEQLQRDLKRLQGEVEELKRDRPSDRREPPVEPPDDQARRRPSAAQLQETKIEQMAREFRGELDYVNERIGVLNRLLDRRVGMSMYVTTEFHAIQKNKPEFAGAKLELFPSIKLTDRLRAFGEFEFIGGSDQNTLVLGGNNNVDLDQAWLEYSVNEYLKPRVGIVLVPFGRFNLESFDPVQEFTTRPIYALKVVPSVWAETAAGFTGRATLGSGEGGGWFKDTAIEYQFYVMNGLNDNISNRDSLRDARGGARVTGDNNHDKAVVGRVLAKLRPGVEIGVSGYTGTYDNTGKRMHAVNVDVRLFKDPFELLAEGATFELEPGGLSSATSQLNQPVPAYLRGGFIEGRYRFWPQWLTGSWLARGFDDPKFAALLRIEQSTVANRLGPAIRESRLSIGMNFRPIPTVAFKAEYLFNFNRATDQPLVFGDNNGLFLSATGAF
jgi:hypothetical protein